MYIDSNFDYLMQGNKYSEQGTNKYYETYQPSRLPGPDGNNNDMVKSIMNPILLY
jgi:hypothetical protein